MSPLFNGSTYIPFGKFQNERFLILNRKFNLYFIRLFPLQIHSSHYVCERCSLNAIITVTILAIISDVFYQIEIAGSEEQEWSYKVPSLLYRQFAIICWLFAFIKNVTGVFSVPSRSFVHSLARLFVNTL